MILFIADPASGNAYSLSAAIKHSTPFLIQKQKNQVTCEHEKAAPFGAAL
jgi:hypothetical protein